MKLQKILLPMVCLLSAAILAEGAETLIDAAPDDQVRGANLLPNPSFEVGAAMPEGWEPRAWNNSEQDTLWAIEALGRTGRCATISAANDRGADAAWTARASVKPHTFYRLSGWIRATDIQGATGVLLNIQNMQTVRTPAVRGTSDWTYVSTIFRTAEAPLELEINSLFGGWGLSTGQAWFDDIALEELDMDEATTARISIDVEAPATPYDRMIFGGFLEHFGRQIYGGVFDPDSPLSDDGGFRLDVIGALRELGVPVIRWPGGCYASGYHWRPGVGTQRQPTDDMVWGVREPNTFGTDEFVELCRLLSAEPYICNNAGDGAIEEMREWVEYCNGLRGEFADLRLANGHPGPLGVGIWSIGNENWGAHEIGAKSSAEWATLVGEAARAMKDADPDILLTAAALPDRQWTLPLLESAGEFLDYISIHQYWIPNWGELREPTYLECIMESEGPESCIASTVSILEEAGRRGSIRIAFDEWNLRSWHHPGFPRKTVQDYDDPEVVALVEARKKSLEPSLYTMADALFSASFLNACLRHANDVGMANIAPLVNTSGPLYVHPGGVVRRTSFHALAMYANLLQGLVGKADVTSGILTYGDRFVPMVDAIATVDEGGNTWAVALINRHPSESVDCTLNLGAYLPDGAFNATVLVGDSPEAYNDIDMPDRVVPEATEQEFRNGATRLAPHSLTIISIPVRARAS